MDSIVSAFRPGLFAARTILITGGSSGIGLGAALLFRDLGATVVATGATATECVRAAADPAHAGVSFRPLDVREGDAVVALMATLPTLDVIVHAAGVIRRDAEHDSATFVEVIDINLNGAMRVCAAAKTKLAASNGSVIAIASILTFFGGSRVPAYSASKGGIGQLTKSLAVAWARDGIRVNAVAPGWIATPLTQALRDDEQASAPILARTPMARWGTPEEIAGAVVFLASPAARFITGTILTVDGGYMAA